MALELAPRRGVYLDISSSELDAISDADVRHLETFDVVYRALCALMYNYVPASGHPGGSISAGRFVAALLFDAMEYDLSNPLRDDADMISYAAGHKALGLYAMWALRNEIASQAAPHLLPADLRHQLRLEDLLGFRRNPLTSTPLFDKLGVKPLDGHPTPATPFVPVSTGASGVGVASSLGLAWGAADYYAAAAPRVHIVEGEGGLTPGRVAEVLAAAGTASLGNAILHVDWNQASIDSNHVCRERDEPGDYVQWNPMELAALHDWNVVYVPDGTNIRQIVAAQHAALELTNGQPTAVVYKTVKGWRYGIEGRASHGAGHALCSEGFYAAAAPLLSGGDTMPACSTSGQRCEGGSVSEVIEDCYWKALELVRKAMVGREAMTAALAARLERAQQRLEARQRKARVGAPRIDAVWAAAVSGAVEPKALRLLPGVETTLREQLGKVLGHYNRRSGGALLAASADLLGSTSTDRIGDGFDPGFYNTRTNPGARLLSIGGICEDGTAGILSGIAAYGRHIGAGSSYGAFNAPLGHIAARLHAIGCQAKRAVGRSEYNPFFLICAHAGLKTGEDGPTHADPQALQLMQGNFPAGTVVTLTPWEPQEVWPLVTEALARRPAVAVPFVTRPPQTVIDREKAGLAPAREAARGVYRLVRAESDDAGVVVLQGSGVTYAFVEEVLPRLRDGGIDLNVYYVASAELFDILPFDEQQKIFPERHAHKAIGITGFTMPTLYRWVRSDRGRALSLHPFSKGHFLGSGRAQMVLAEAGLDGEGQVRAIERYLEARW